MGRKVKCLRTDNGTEYTNKEFLRYCEEHGIRRHFTVPRIPQQNGRAKGHNRTLREIARYIRLNVWLPKVFWAKFVNMACYIINRLPRFSLDRKVAERS